jgi:pantoate--beta-alanine ligase
MWSAAIDLITTTAAMQQWAASRRRQGADLALVPTMGYLHEGHLALMREARRRARLLVVSIFVNPTQFGPGEDFAAYPRDLERDMELVRAVGADALFAPPAEELYEPGCETTVHLERLPQHLCGLHRPGHFRGVATVVAKLLNIVLPRVALFGEKDYQQLVVIRRMVRDLNFDVQIVGLPTVREPDGLAMSSRNAYLGVDQRPAAVSLSSALRRAQASVAAGERDPQRLIAAAREHIGAFADTRIEYIAIVEPETLEDLSRLQGPARMCLAVRVGRTRLIDNAPLVP